MWQSHVFCELPRFSPYSLSSVEGISANMLYSLIFDYYMSHWWTLWKTGSCLFLTQYKYISFRGWRISWEICLTFAWVGFNGICLAFHSHVDLVLNRMDRLVECSSRWTAITFYLYTKPDLACLVWGALNKFSSWVFAFLWQQRVCIRSAFLHHALKVCKIMRHPSTKMYLLGWRKLFWEMISLFFCHHIGDSPFI